MRSYLQRKGVVNPGDALANICVNLREDMHFGRSAGMGVQFSVVPVPLFSGVEGCLPRLVSTKRSLKWVFIETHSNVRIILYVFESAEWRFFCFALDARLLCAPAW